jgi:Carboxypeptidase regulatory-like domain
MNWKAPSRALPAAILVVSLVITPLLHAQQPDATLTGTVTSPSGGGIANSVVSVKNLNTGAPSTTQTDSAGRFVVPNLASGDYEVSASTDGLNAVSRLTLAAHATQSVNLTPTTQSQPQTPAGNLPNAPSSSKTEPSLSDLGFTPEQTQANAKEQALLDKRTRMLKIHQKLGLITAAPLIATIVTSLGAGGKHTSNTDRTVHMVLGAVSSDLYFTSAYFAIRAPNIKGTSTRGPIRVHKALAWIHGPGMILTPILGALAYQQKNDGEKVHGIAAAHGPVAIVTAGAFGAALLSVSLKF